MEDREVLEVEVMIMMMMMMMMIIEADIQHNQELKVDQ